VAEELELLRSAEVEFHAGSPAQALALLDEHARRFPRGVLVEERRASRILALCRLGQAAAARSEADAFVAQYPSSPFVERVRRACAR
jgi:outer membrane protein assembly factor BamD (BamD/ComL family)